MQRVIATTQFVFIALGTMAMNILARTTHSTEHTPVENLRMYLAVKGLWLFLIPLAWLVCAEVALNASKSDAMQNAVRYSGVAVAAVIFLLYAWLVLSVST